MLEELTEQAKLAVEQVLDAAKLERGGLFVVGCSSSEVCGSKIGTNSSLETAQAVLAGIYPVLKERGIYLADSAASILTARLLSNGKQRRNLATRRSMLCPSRRRAARLQPRHTQRLHSLWQWKRCTRMRGWILAAHSLACISSGWRFPSALQSNKLGRRTCFVHGRGQNLSAACGHTMMKANYEPAYWTRGAVQRDAPRPCILKKHVLYSVL